MSRSHALVHLHSSDGRHEYFFFIQREDPVRLQMVSLTKTLVISWHSTLKTNMQFHLSLFDIDIKGSGRYSIYCDSGILSMPNKGITSCLATLMFGCELVKIRENSCVQSRSTGRSATILHGEDSFGRSIHCALRRTAKLEYVSKVVSRSLACRRAIRRNWCRCRAFLS